MRWKIMAAGVLILAPAIAARATPPAAATRGVRVLTLLSDFNSVPFSFLDAGRKRGFEIDLGEALGKELGARTAWVQRAFNIPTIVSTLDAGTADAAICSITITEDRRKQMDFSVPYYRTNLSVATLKDVDWNHQDFENGLKAETMGVLRGTTGEAWAKKYFKGRRITYYSTERMASDLKNEKVFCILMDEDILLYTLADNFYRFQIVERDIDRESYGIAVRKGNTALLSEINAALTKLDEKNIYDDLYKKWFTHRADLPKPSLWH